MKKLRAVIFALAIVLTPAIGTSFIPGNEVQAQALSIPNDILNAESFTPDQRQRLNAIVKPFIERLKETESTAEIRDLVGELMKHLTIGSGGIGSNTFKVEYSSILSSEMTRLMAGEFSPTKKSAVLKIASQLALGTGHILALNGLNNDDPAVRFWATKATIEIISRSIRQRAFRGNGIKVRDMITEQLKEAMTNEPEPIVMQQYYLAMGLLRTNASVSAMLEVLNQRLATKYKDGINDNIRADQVGIFRCWRTLYLNTGTVDQKQVKQLVITSVLYAQMARLALAQNNVSLENYAATMNMLTTSESVILMAIEMNNKELFESLYAVNPAGERAVKADLSVKAAVENADQGTAIRNYGNWIQLLTNPDSKMGYKEADFIPPANPGAGG